MLSEFYSKYAMTFVLERSQKARVRRKSVYLLLYCGSLLRSGEYREKDRRGVFSKRVPESVWEYLGSHAQAVDALDEAIYKEETTVYFRGRYTVFFVSGHCFL